MEEETVQEKTKRKWVKKTVYLVILLLIVFMAYRTFATSVVPAQVNVETGQVFVNGERISGNINLREGDVVSTGNDGKATVYLYESVVIALQLNTEVSITDLIEEHPKIRQEKGTTWNQFTKLGQVGDYTTESSTAVASVRSTGFEFSDSFILGGEGKVDYGFNGLQFIVSEKRVVENGVERAATPEEIARVKEHLRHSVEALKFLRQKEIDAHPFIVGLVFASITGKVTAVDAEGNTISERDLSQSEVDSYLAQADRGDADVDAIVKKIPVKVGFVTKVADFTKEIQEIQKVLEGY